MGFFNTDINVINEQVKVILVTITYDTLAYFGTMTMVTIQGFPANPAPKKESLMPKFHHEVRNRN